MYSRKLPACPTEQVTKMRDGAFLSVKDTHHLFVGVRGRKKKKKKGMFKKLSIILSWLV